MPWQPFNRTVLTLEVYASDRDISHILERFNERQLNFTDIDLALRKGHIVQAMETVCSDDEEFLVGTDTLKFLYNDGVTRSGVISSFRDYTKDYALHINIHTAILSEKKKRYVNGEREVIYRFDTSLLKRI